MPTHHGARKGAILPLNESTSLGREENNEWRAGLVVCKTIRVQASRWQETKGVEIIEGCRTAKWNMKRRCDAAYSTAESARTTEELKW